jgi:hypothetical protein
MKIEMINWHRLFGLTLIDFFDNTVYKVELEKDLTINQYIDIVIIKKESGGEIQEVPDGLDNLSDYNLVTYKSFRESLNIWALDELLAYYVMYRKMLAGKDKKLLGDEKFCLYALSTRRPKKLFNHKIFNVLMQGVYEAEWGGKHIRVIVPEETAPIPRNALWHLLSGKPDNILYGAHHYHVRQEDDKAIIYQLFKAYKMEGITMSYTREDFFKDFTKENLYWLTPEERMDGIPLKERLKGIPLKERLEGLSKEELEELEEYLKKIKSDM